jgi:hypothetical protein
MRAARRLLLTTAMVSAVAGVVGAPPAQAAVQQHCRYAKGAISASPGLTDVPTGQTVTLGARLWGCSRSGGSGGFVATIGVSATCATLTTALPPTNTTILWADGRTSAVSLSFSSLPGATNRLAVTGRVNSGTGAGDRIEGGLHLSTVSSRLVGQDNHRVKVKQHQPLSSQDTVCTVAHPLATIKVSSYQSFKFTLISEVTSTTSGSPTRGTQPGTSVGSASSTTTATPTPAAGAAIARNRAAVARQKAALARKRQSRRSAALRGANAVASAVGTGTTSSGSFFDPEWALGAGCIAAAVILLIVLLMPSKRPRRRRPPIRTS